MAVRVKVDGLADLRRRMDELEPRLKKAALRKALLESGKVYQAEIRKNVAGLDLAPKAKKVLAKSILVRVANRRGRLTAQVRIRKPDRRSEEKRDAYYWRWVEFGTARRYRELYNRRERGDIWVMRPEVITASGQVRRATAYRKRGIVKKFHAYTGFIKPQPFVRPAAQSAQERAVEVLDQELRKQVEEAFRG